MRQGKIGGGQPCVDCRGEVRGEERRVQREELILRESILLRRREPLLIRISFHRTHFPETIGSWSGAYCKTVRLTTLADKRRKR